MYEHDWADYHLMGVPFILERVVIADRVAAEMGATKENSNPFFAAPFVRLPESRHWLEPIRRSLVLFLDMVEERMKKTKPVVTYLQTQEQSQGPRLRDGDHRALVDALKKMGRDYGYEVHVVSDSVTRWHERMNAIARSTVSPNLFHEDIRRRLTVNIC